MQKVLIAMGYIIKLRRPFRLLKDIMLSDIILNDLVPLSTSNVVDYFNNIIGNCFEKVTAHFIYHWDMSIPILTQIYAKKTAT